MILNKVQNSITVCAVKAPSYGDNRKAILNDIAILTGATVVSEEVGVTFEDSDESILGHAGKIEITKEDTVILNGNGDKYKLFYAGLPLTKELLKSKTKSITPPALMIRKNSKKDFQSFPEVLVSSRLEELLRSKLEKSRIEYRMLSVQLRLPLKKALLSVEDAHCFMLVELLTH